MAFERHAVSILTAEISVKLFGLSGLDWIRVQKLAMKLRQRFEQQFNGRRETSTTIGDLQNTDLRAICFSRRLAVSEGGP